MPNTPAAERSEAARIFDEALRGRSVTDAPLGGAAPRWSAGREVLVYAVDFRATTTLVGAQLTHPTPDGQTTMAGHPVPSGIAVTGRFRVQPAATGVTVGGEELRSTLVSGDVRGARQPLEGATGPVGLRTDGASWIETTAPAPLWNRMGSLAGLSIGFPALPATAAIGSAASWSPGWRTSSVPVQVRLTRWIAVDGHRCAVLEGKWTDTHRSDSPAAPIPSMPGMSMGPMSTSVELRGQGHWVICAGALLHASVVERAALVLTSPEARQEHRLENRFELRLIEGGALALREPPAPPVEQALAGVQAFRDALLVPDGDVAVRPLLTPALAQAHDGRVAATLRRQIQRYGLSALGTPEFTLDSYDPSAAPVVRGSRVELTLSAGFGGEPAAGGMVRYVIELTPGGPRVDSVDVTHYHGERLLLHASADRLEGEITRWTPGPGSVTRMTDVVAPESGFVLARRGGAVCALRVHQRDLGSASFEWFHFPRGLGDRRPPATGTGVASSPGDRIVWGSVQAIRCGPMELAFTLPRSLTVELEDTDYALVTSSATIEELRAAAARIRWFHARWGEAAWDPTIDAELHRVAQEELERLRAMAPTP